MDQHHMTAGIAVAVPIVGMVIPIMMRIVMLGRFAFNRLDALFLSAQLGE